MARPRKDAVVASQVAEQAPDDAEDVIAEVAKVAPKPKGIDLEAIAEKLRVRFEPHEHGGVFYGEDQRKLSVNVANFADEGKLIAAIRKHGI